MAARVTTFNADGVKEREVLYVRYELHQDTDPEGQTAGPVRGGKIYVKVKSHDDGNTDLLEWMCSESDRKDGTITYPNHQGGEMKHLDFKEGYMVEYAETYDNSVNYRRNAMINAPSYPSPFFRPVLSQSFSRCFGRFRSLQG